jgi:DNA-directed RNA polymerase subunit alpha
MLQPNFFTKKGDQTQEYGTFVLEPLPLSFGNSMGNALRRTLLSSLKGAAITQIRLNNADHLFSTVKGVKESALEIILNMKQLRFTDARDGEHHIKIEVKGAKMVTGKDVSGDVQVANTDLHIAELTDEKGKLDIEAVVVTGVGSLMEDEIEKKESDFIAVDAYFSPVKKVNFKIEEARVGRKTNFDRLVLQIWTDGTISPEDALRQSGQIMSEHFSHILSGRDNPVTTSDAVVEGAAEEKEVDQRLKDIIIDELNLPSRVINALLRENIETVADLVKVDKEKLIGVKGLGKKSFVLIEEELKKMGIDLNS